MLHEIPFEQQKARAAFVEQWNTPPPGAGVATVEDEDTLAMLEGLVEVGQARDVDDARLIAAHRERVSREEDPLARAALMAEFAATRNQAGVTD